MAARHAPVAGKFEFAIGGSPDGLRAGKRETAAFKRAALREKSGGEHRCFAEIAARTRIPFNLTQFARPMKVWRAFRRLQDIMKFRIALWAALLAVGAPISMPAARAQTEVNPATYVGPAMVAVEQIATTWRDDKRRRDVPVKIFVPRTAGPFPLIILSHGLGGSRDGLDYLGRSWAEHGYVCAQIQHLGTDEELWRNAKTEAEAESNMKRAAGDLNNILNRPRDVSFAIDQMLKLNADENSVLNGKINAAAIGVAGHSLGGLTALFSAGQRAITGGFSVDLSDPRIKASVSMSAPLNPQAPINEQFADFKLPNFYLVGAKDNSILGATIAQRQVYDAIGAPEQYLLILTGADHMTFGGARFGPDLPGDKRDHALTQEATLAFWEGELKGNERAKSWLKSEFETQLDGASVFESK